jgi:hypothetical protein
VDFFLWPDNGPVSGGPSSKCQAPGDTTSCDETAYPKTITITEPDDTTRTSPPAPMYFTVVNNSGVNTGYTITAQWFTFTLPPPPKFSVPTIPVSNQVSGPSAAGGPSLPSIGPIDTSGAPPRTVLVPGPDGKLRQITIPAFAAGDSLTSADAKPRSPWVPAYIAGAVVLVGLSTYLVFRARAQDRAATEL